MKKKKKTITITAEKTFQEDKLILNKLGNSYVYYSPLKDKKIKTDFITCLKKGHVAWVMFNTENGESSVAVDITEKQFEQFIRNYKKRKQTCKNIKGNYLVHLNPEITFVVKGK